MTFKTTTEFKPEWGPERIKVYHDTDGNEGNLPTVWLRIDSPGVSMSASMTPSEATEFAMALMRSSFECRELIEEIDARRPTALPPEASHAE